MSRKLTCPNCDTHTSAIFHAYSEGLPCPYCGLSLTDSDGRTARSYYAQLPDDHTWAGRVGEEPR